MDIEEKLEQLEQAIDLIQEANEIVDEVMEDSSNGAHYKAYGKYGFNQLLGLGNPYDGSLQKIINNLEEEL